MCVLKAKRFHRSTENNSFDRAKTKCAIWFRRLKTKIESKKRSKKRACIDQQKRSGTAKDAEQKKNENSLGKEMLGTTRWARVEKTNISHLGVYVKNIKKHQTFTVVAVKNICKQHVWKERDLHFLTNIFSQWTKQNR